LRDRVNEVTRLGGTKSKILHELRAGDRTARDVAARLRVQVSAARKHLERLKELGLVEERFVRHGPGRPRKLYLLTDAGKELFPRRYDAILNAVLARITRDRGGDYTEQLLRNVADDTVKDVRLGRGRMNRLIGTLNDLGFDASLQTRDSTRTITSRNCPILRVALAHREVVCRGFHAEVIRRATGAASVQRGKWIVDGDPVCTHMFSEPQADRDSSRKSRKTLT
jgi:DeoR family transcriptional regulator, suf operon transcriptional repressor